MAEIKITDLDLNGNDLFDDHEGFMDELSEDIFDQVKGGAIPIPNRCSPYISTPTLPNTLPYPPLIL